MCGIAGFVTRDLVTLAGDVSWIRDIADRLEAAPPGADATDALSSVIALLHERFIDLMSLSTHRAIISDQDLFKRFRAIADSLSQHEAALVELSKAGRTDLDPLIEGLRDYAWQIRHELFGHIDGVGALMGTHRDGAALGVAFATEHVLRAIDRLEVRGRDSAGITVQLALTGFDPASLPAALADDLQARMADTGTGHRAVMIADGPSGQTFVGFIYKTANLIGRLGDNGAALRSALSGDELFWLLAEKARSANVLAHTRWASSGIISVPNCHPHNAAVTSDVSGGAELGGMFVLNGDIDNHMELFQELVASQGLGIEPAITTDAKIIPIVHRYAKGSAHYPLDRFRAAIRRLDGSMAIAAIDLRRPGEALVAQKGSGQGLYAAPVADGWVYASEAYGLASTTRSAFNLASNVQGGSVARLDAGLDEPEVHGVVDGAGITVSQDTIQIFARDIYRGRFEFFLEKEIHDAPLSVAKTLRGRYRHTDGLIAFDGLPIDLWSKLRQRVKGGLRRVYVIGQGTAGVAGVGIAHLIERALSRDAHRSIPVRALRSSELSAEIDAYDFRDSLVVAVSQSGTTTDTNRAVDLARERGAFVHAIVNRRNSDLVRKSDSVLFTSDGRDVEMSVASTKAFYSQLTAGKLTALFLADALAAMTRQEIQREMAELEALPSKIGAVLSMDQEIAECARTFAPRARYWAVTGSGVNQIAALEIRIKLSELCYKSIPVDYTEDKKHIDLSTEPLTLVIANDLPAGVAGDVVKEVAIFKAHNGRPIVFATQGPDAEAFTAYAERVVRLPSIGADLGFVLATVAGHLFGFHAARAIDAGAQKLKEIMVKLGRSAETEAAEDVGEALTALDAFIAEAARGEFDSGLGARDIASLATVSRAIGMAYMAGDIPACVAYAREALTPVRKAFEETSRPVDTIRHQAKTVTVGTSRPDDALSPAVRDALARIGITESRISNDDRKALSIISRLIDQVDWASELSLSQAGTDQRVRNVEETAPLALRRYSQWASPVGLIGAAIDEKRLQVGRLGNHAAIVVPVQGDDASEPIALVCMSVKAYPYASREQKLAALTVLGLFKRKLREWEAHFDAEAEVELMETIACTEPAGLLFDVAALDPASRILLRQSA